MIKVRGRLTENKMIKENILFVAGNFYPYPSANGVCLENLAEELSKSVNVHYLCEGLEDCIFPYPQRNDIHTYKSLEFINKKESIAGKLWRMIKIKFFIPSAPFISKRKTKRILNMVLKLHQRFHYTKIIAVVAPAEAACACMEMKKKVSEISFITYELDSMTDNSFYWKGWRQYFKPYIQNMERNIYECADKVIHMKSHEEYYKDLFYSHVSDKFVTSDIPMITNKFNAIQFSRDKKRKLLFFYAGSLSEKFRKPTYLLRLLFYIRNLNYSMIFCSRGCRMELEREKRNNNKIQIKGYVSKKELNHWFSQADILISIGNSMPEAVPSKIFQYISIGKPVIHFFSIEQDSCLPYLKEYPLCLFIDERKDLSWNARRVIEYLEKLKDVSNIQIDIYEKYYRNRPQYTTNIILYDKEKYEQ